MKRTFIGFKIESSPSIERLFNELKKSFSHSQLNWIDPGNLHLTLRFLGNTDESQIESINQKLDVLLLQVHPFKLEIRNLGYFGSRSSPRVLWAGIFLPKEVYKMVDEMENIVEALGFERETKPYSPHLTLGRIKTMKDHDALAILIEKYKNHSFNEQVVDEITFYESVLGKSGSVYKPIRIFFLDNPDE